MSVDQFGLGRRHGLLDGRGAGSCSEAFGPIELLMRSAELAPPTLGEGIAPGFGYLARPPERRTANPMSRQFLNALEHLVGLAGIEPGANLVGDPIGYGQSRCRERIRRCTNPIGEVEVFDGTGKIVGPGATRCTCHQVQRQPPAKLHGVMMIGDLRPARKGVCLGEPTQPRGFICLPQNDAPMSQHG